MEDQVKDLIERGVEAMGLQQYEAALVQFQKALSLDSHDVAVYLHIGNAYMNMDEPEKAMDSFRRALLIDENSVEALYAMGCAYFIIDDPVNAIRYFNRVEERGGATTDMYVIESSIFIDAEDYNMAIRALNRALQIEPLNADLMLGKAEIYAIMGRIDDAVSALRNLQEILPDEIAGYVSEARLLIDADRGDDAMAALVHAEERFPTDAGIRALKAKALNTMARYDEALHEAEQALVVDGLGDKVRSELQLQLSIAYAGVGRVEEASLVLEESAKEGNAAESYYMLMNESIMLQNYAKALECSNRLLELGDVPPRISASACFNKAFAMEKVEGVDAAREAYADAALRLRRITIVNPGLYEVYAYRVMAHRSLGEFDKALDLADYLISLDVTAPASYALKSDVLREQGNYDESDKLRAKVLTLDPNFIFGE